MPFRIIRNDITKVTADAIVNTADPRPVAGGGTDGAIYEAAGKESLLKARQQIGDIKRGDAAVTRAYNLPAKYIIHTVGPVWEGGGHGEREILRSCYEKSLDLARRLDCRSIAFPLIAAGIYGFPKDEALEIAVSAFSRFLADYEMDITLVVFSRQVYVLSDKIFAGVETYIDDHYVEIREQREYYRRDYYRKESESRPYKEPLDDSGYSPGNLQADRADDFLFDMDEEAELDEEFEKPVARPPMSNAARPPLSNASRPPQADAGRPKEEARKRPVSEPSFLPGESGRENIQAEILSAPRKKKGFSALFDDRKEKGFSALFGSRKEKSLDELMAQAGETFQEMLFRLILEKGLTNPEVYKRANLDRRLFSKIQSDPNYQPKKNTAIALALALHLNLEETRDLMSRAGYVFSPSSKPDLVIEFCIVNEIYDVMKINLLLFKYDFPILV